LKIHIVQKGDTLWELAKKYDVDFEELKQLNSHLSSPDMIMPGMKIKIPSTTKTVKKEKMKEEQKKMAVPPYKDISPKPMPVIEEDDKKIKKTIQPEMPIKPMPQMPKMPFPSIPDQPLPEKQKPSMPEIPIMEQEVKNNTPINFPHMHEETFGESPEYKGKFEKELPKHDVKHGPVYQQPVYQPIPHVIPVYYPIFHPCCPPPVPHPQMPGMFEGMPHPGVPPMEMPKTDCGCGGPAHEQIKYGEPYKKMEETPYYMQPASVAPTLGSEGMSMSPFDDHMNSYMKHDHQSYPHYSGMPGFYRNEDEEETTGE